MVEKVYVTYNQVSKACALPILNRPYSYQYNQVHKLCQASAEHILNEFRPQLMIAIGGGGYVPARILRHVGAVFFALVWLRYPKSKDALTKH